MIAIMSDCDCLDPRDFPIIKEYVDSLNIPIDWSFFIRNICQRHPLKCKWKGGEDWYREYGDCRMISYDDEIIKKMIQNGEVRTIHANPRHLLGDGNEFTSTFKKIVSEIRNPILSLHGNVGPKLLDALFQAGLHNYIKNVAFGSCKYIENYFKAPVVYENNVNLIRRYYPSHGRIEYLGAIMKRIKGRNAIIATHVGHSYSKQRKEEYFGYIENIKIMAEECGEELVSLDVLLKEFGVYG